MEICESEIMHKNLEDTHVEKFKDVNLVNIDKLKTKIFEQKKEVIKNVAPSVPSETFISVYENKTIIDLSNNKDNLKYIIVEKPLYGFVSIQGSKAIYQTIPNFIGNDIFTFKAFDGSLYSETAKIFVTINKESKKEIKTKILANVDINSLLDVKINGAKIIPENILGNKKWNTFVISKIDTTDPEFLNKVYVVKWTNPESANQHGGYFLDYDGFTDKNKFFERNGGPIWWFYNGQKDWRQYQTENQTGVNSSKNITPLVVPDELLNYNELYIKFTSFESWKVSMDHGTNWYDIYSIIGKFPNTINFCYKMHVKQGLTSKHNFTFEEVIKEKV